MARCWLNFDAEIHDQILTSVDVFWTAVTRPRQNNGHTSTVAHGSSTDARRHIYPDAQLSERNQRLCHSLIFRIDTAVAQPGITEEAVTCLTERRRQLLLALPPVPRCHLLGIPAELREIIWVHAVTEWTIGSTVPDTSALLSDSRTRELVQRPIRIDRFNRPRPAPITLASQQLRAETLQLYYQENIWECWRPLFWLKDWSESTLIDWLSGMGPGRTKWLTHIVLLYKHESELQYGIQGALEDEGFMMSDCTVEDKQELSEYEMCFEELGLPRHFGRKRKWDRWMAGSAAT